MGIIRGDLGKAFFCGLIADIGWFWFVSKETVAFFYGFWGYGG